MFAFVVCATLTGSRMVCPALQHYGSSGKSVCTHYEQFREECLSSSGKSVCIRGVCNAHWLKDGVSSTAALWLTMSSSGKSVCTRGVCKLTG